VTERTQNKLRDIRRYAESLKLTTMIQSGMPGFVVTIYAHDGRRLFGGNLVSADAFLQGFADGIKCLDATNPYYNESAIPDWYGNK
jgi:hypothetical protein